MTDKEEQTSDNQIDDLEPQVDESLEDDSNDDLDIEGALAAVASLQDLTREAEAEIEEAEESELEEDDALEIQEFERIDSDDTTGDALEESDEQIVETASPYDSIFPHPPQSVLHRGQLASVVPAILLIGIGGYLTFIVTASDTVLQPAMVIAVLIGGTGAMLLAQWISSARWSIGSFFIGVLLLLTGTTATYLALPNNLSPVDGYPLLLTAIGTAFVITDIFVPSGRRVWLIGLILAIAGLAGVLTTSVIMNLDIAEAFAGLLPVAVVIIIVLLIAPILRRRQQ